MAEIPNDNYDSHQLEQVSSEPGKTKSDKELNNSRREHSTADYIRQSHKAVMRDIRALGDKLKKAFTERKASDKKEEDQLQLHGLLKSADSLETTPSDGKVLLTVDEQRTALSKTLKKLYKKPVHSASGELVQVTTTVTENQDKNSRFVATLQSPNYVAESSSAISSVTFEQKNVTTGETQQLATMRVAQNAQDARINAIEIPKKYNLETHPQQAWANDQIDCWGRAFEVMADSNPSLILNIPDSAIMTPENIRGIKSSLGLAEVATNQLQVMSQGFVHELSVDDDQLHYRIYNKEDDATCSISQTAICELEDPVLASDGRVYSEAGLKAWQSRSNTSPVTRQPIMGVLSVEKTQEALFKTNPSLLPTEKARELQFKTSRNAIAQSNLMDTLAAKQQDVFSHDQLHYHIYNKEDDAVCSLSYNEVHDLKDPALASDGYVYSKEYLDTALSYDQTAPMGVPIKGVLSVERTQEELFKTNPNLLSAEKAEELSPKQTVPTETPEAREALRQEQDAAFEAVKAEDLAQRALKESSTNITPDKIRQDQQKMHEIVHEWRKGRSTPDSTASESQAPNDTADSSHSHDLTSTTPSPSGNGESEIRRLKRFDAAKKRLNDPQTPHPESNNHTPSSSERSPTNTPSPKRSLEQKKIEREARKQLGTLEDSEKRYPESNNNTPSSSERSPGNVNAPKRDATTAMPPEKGKILRDTTVIETVQDLWEGGSTPRHDAAMKDSWEKPDQQRQQQGPDDKSPSENPVSPPTPAPRTSNALKEREPWIEQQEAALQGPRPSYTEMTPSVVDHVTAANSKLIDSSSSLRVVPE